MKSNDVRTYPSGVKVVRRKKFKVVILSKSMLIHWDIEIPCYIYTAENQLIVPDNQEGKILIYDMQHLLKIESEYNIDLDIKKMNYFINDSRGKV
jgi:hypothetical protein